MVRMNLLGACIARDGPDSLGSFKGLARLSRRGLSRFLRRSREISSVPSLHRASTDTLILSLLFTATKLWDLNNYYWALSSVDAPNFILQFHLFGLHSV